MESTVHCALNTDTFVLYSSPPRMVGPDQCSARAIDASDKRPGWKWHRLGRAAEPQNESARPRDNESDREGKRRHEEPGRSSRGVGSDALATHSRRARLRRNDDRQFVSVAAVKPVKAAKAAAVKKVAVVAAVRVGPS
ncbi:unnamed protein product [Lampetra planeri]